MYCFKCGKEISDESKFCYLCGAEIKIDVKKVDAISKDDNTLKRATEENDKSSDEDRDVVSESRINVSSSVEESALVSRKTVGNDNSEDSKENKNSNVNWKMIAIIVAIIAIIAIVIVVVAVRPSGEYQTEIDELSQYREIRSETDSIEAEVYSKHSEDSSQELNSNAATSENVADILHDYFLQYYQGQCATDIYADVTHDLSDDLIVVGYSKDDISPYVFMEIYSYTDKVQLIYASDPLYPEHTDGYTEYSLIEENQKYQIVRYCEYVWQGYGNAFYEKFNFEDGNINVVDQMGKDVELTPDNIEGCLAYLQSYYDNVTENGVLLISDFYGDLVIDGMSKEAFVSGFEQSGEGVISSTESVSSGSFLPYGINEGNSLTQGFLVEQDDWIYFIVSDNLYKQDKSGNTYVLFSGCGVYDSASLNICGDYLYWARNNHGDGYVIDRIRTNGEDYSTVIYDAVECTFICDYKDNSLWYVSTDHIGSAKLSPIVCNVDLDTLQLKDTVSLENFSDGEKEYEISAIAILGLDSSKLIIDERLDAGYGNTYTLLGTVDKKTYTHRRIIDIIHGGDKVCNGKEVYFLNDTGSINRDICRADMETYTITNTAAKLSWDYNGLFALKDNELWVKGFEMHSLTIEKLPDTVGYPGNGDRAFKANVIGDYVYYIPSEPDDGSHSLNMVCKMLPWGEDWEIIFDESTEVQVINY